MKLSIKYKILYFAFFIVLITSLWKNNIYLLFSFSILCWVFLPKRKWWDNSTIFLLFFSLFYGIMVYMNHLVGSVFNLLSYFLAPVAFYRLGQCSMNIFKEENSRQKFILIVVLCYLIYLYQLTLKDIALVGIVNDTRILLEDSGESYEILALTATLYGMMASIGIGCIASIYTKKQKLWLKLGFILLSIFSLLVAIHLVNRTGLIICFTCLVVSFIISTRFNVIKMTVMLSILVLIGFIIVSSGVIDQEIFDAYSKREEHSTYDASTLGGRSELWLISIENLFRRPFGWSANEHGFAHNLWLDIARVGGLLPFLPFLAVTFLYLKNLLRLITKKSSSNFIIIMISINIGTLLSSAVEPVIGGSLLFFCLLMMIWGMTKSLAVEKNI